MDRLVWGLLATLALAGAVDYSLVGNIHYDRYPETVLDILQPPHPALSDRPGVVMIHGGEFLRGSKSEMVEFCKPLLERDYVIANIDYRLADVAQAPAAVTDVLKASRWFVEHAADYRVNPKKILVAGFSTGGYLGLMAGMVPGETDLGPTTRFAGIIDFYGIADLEEAWQARREYAVQWLAPAGDVKLARKLSPIQYVRKDVPPVLIIHGDKDDVVPYQQSVQLSTALKKAGAKTELITVAGGKHGFTQAELADIWPQIFKWLKKMKVA